jgi:hypothetical protein
MLLSRMWLATVTGPNRHNAGATAAKMRGDDARPGTSKIGIVLSMLGSGSGKIHENRLVPASLRLKARRGLSNRRKVHVNPEFPALTRKHAKTM